MAHQEEDLLLAHARSTTAPEDTDLTDEVQDFRFLSTLSRDAAPDDSPSLPRRGEKDFEPHGTRAQIATLTASRAAMHAALSRPRTHPSSKSAAAPLVGIYTPPQSSPQPTTNQGDPITASRYCAVIRNPRGSHFRTIGKVGSDELMRLLPEEALYLLERGSLDLRWPAIQEENRERQDGVGDGDADGDEDEDDDGDDEDDDEDMNENENENENEDEDDDEDEDEDDDENEDGNEDAESETDIDATASVLGTDVPLSLQAAYACLVGTSGLTLERYNVYAGLKRSGYIVQRGPAWNPEDDVDTNDIDMPDVGTTSTVADASTQQQLEQKPLARFAWLYRSIFGPSSMRQSPKGPLVAPGLYRSYHDVYKLLSIIPSQDPTQKPPQTTPQQRQPPSSHPQDRSTRPSSPHPPLRPCFYVWKPQSGFRKSAPGPPDFRIAVVNARTDDFPTLDQLDGLLQSVPYDAPREGGGKGRYSALKHGWRNVILAVVDQGVVSYIRVGACAFAHEKLLQQNAALKHEARGKGGGGGGGGGGGMGRGGGSARGGKGSGARGRGRGKGR